MKSLTASAHLEPDSTSRVSVFGVTDDSGPFVSLRIGGERVDIALIARPGTADALRALARAADEAATALDQIADTAADGDA
ncbi:hypothetical protein ACF09J_05025 [Streptomyces sp. NPDC014889]|uniref:hypothetical protein n=1 Tax=Streptomyces sp. NPDC014889 TaxID=3364928 RepID=UPI0036FA1617